MCAAVCAAACAQRVHSLLHRRDSLTLPSFIFDDFVSQLLLEPFTAPSYGATDSRGFGVAIQACLAGYTWYYSRHCVGKLGG